MQNFQLVNKNNLMMDWESWIFFKKKIKKFQI